MDPGAAGKDQSRDREATGVDVLGKVYALVTAKHGLGWSPSEFWNATTRETWIAIDEAEKHAKLMAKHAGGT